MSENPPASPTPDSARRLRAFGLAALALLAIVAAIVARRPDWRLLAEEGWIIQLHLAAAVTALLIGLAQLAGIKGDRLHRGLGWTWVFAMAIVALTSLFITEINPGRYSLIHLLTGWTIITLPMAVWAARRGRIRIHRRAMTGLFVGGLLIAGAFTFVPGRLLYRLFIGD